MGLTRAETGRLRRQAAGLVRAARLGGEGLAGSLGRSEGLLVECE